MLIPRTSPRWRALAALALVLMLGSWVGTPVLAASTGAAGADVTFGVQPSRANGPDGRPYFVWGATPGARITDHVAVVNYSNEPLELSLYSTDAVNTEDGGFGLLPTDTKPTDVGAWVHLGGVGKTVDVPARSGGQPSPFVVPVHMNVPADASPGDHTGAVVAVLTSIDPTAEGTNVRLEQRVGSRIFVQVAGEVDAQLSVTDLSASYHGTWNPFGSGNATVDYTLTNTGNVNLGAKAAVTVSGSFSDASANAADIPLLLPGSSVDVSVDVPSVLPQVWMTATVDVTPVSPDSGPERHAPNVAEATPFWAIPWTLIALIVLSLVIATGYYWRRRRRRARIGRGTGKHAESRRVPVSEGVSS